MHELLTDAIRAGVQFEADGNNLRVTAPEGALTDGLRQALRLHKPQILEFLKAGKMQRAHAPLPLVEHDAAHRDQPFPLSELQHAYWFGRDSKMEMGGIASHVYIELDCPALDLAKLNHALGLLIERQPMLRAVIDRDGLQRILPAVPHYRIAVADCAQAAPADIDGAIDATRQVLSHQVLDPQQWPLFDVRATILSAARLRLHVSLDLLIFDAGSLHIFFREWHQLYQDPQAALPALGISFRDYIVADRALQSSSDYLRAHAYWMEQVDDLPAAPDLPLCSDPAARLAPRFCRREAQVEKVRWDQIKAAARAHRLTPSSVLLALYAEVLARWSSTPQFTVNVTMSNRRALHPDVPGLLGNFTAPVLHGVDRSDPQLPFAEFARRLQQRLLTDLEHGEVSGVTVLREWTRRRGVALQAAMPVVFSSALTAAGEKEIGDLEQFGAKVYGISQTSQVWLDHHVSEVQGNLLFNWDVADAVFEDGVPDAMFSAYCDAILRLCDDPSLWDSRDIVALPAAMQGRREQADQTAQPIPQRCLHAGFVAQARNRPQAIAIASLERTLSYGELLGASAAVADRLMQGGAGAGHPVAVLMRKGWEQIVAVYGVLLAGAAYMPIDADLPLQRQLELLKIGEITQVLTQPGVLREEIAAAGVEVVEVDPAVRSAVGAAHLRSLEAPPEQLAYVIFTSGTTGVPKGVMIDHRGAVNTIEYINQLYGVGPQDRVLAVSSLSFDLSVYDIFGLLDAGGALVLPDWRKGHDPVHWRELMVRRQVTLWNSAPQLMHMLMESFHAGDRDAAPLRTVLLSGDFIPLDLPDRIRRRYTGAKVISLGGATEASIWSVYYPVDAVEPDWTSIPYGSALPNQTIRVLDAALRPCPDHVKGRIHIGGIGLAKGYWRDAAQTAARFITHPESGERLYDTGDLGRHAPDGKLLILGRDDGQVKIRGHRIELGEIEAVLAQHPQVRQAVVLPTSDQPAQRQLAAYVECAGTAVSAQALKEYLSGRLPDYMVPLYLVLLDAMPVSSNGKIDYRALPPVSPELDGGLHQPVGSRSAEEQAILAAWARVMPDCEIGVTDNFFELGGNSILATQLVRELNATLPLFKLQMHELFENLTVELLALLYLSRAARSGHQAPAESDDGDRAIVADIGAARDDFSHLDFNGQFSEKQAASGPARAILLTGATGWIGAHLLSDLLTLTQAKLYCLVRPGGMGDDGARLMETMRHYGIAPEPSWRGRIEVVNGDLSLPQLGLAQDRWQQLAESVDSIYHFGASLNVLADYAAHRQTNVTAMASIVRLATQGHLKPVFFASPMAVCRRRREGRVVVLHEERSHPDPAGLLTGYAQSKWAAEQILLAAVERGLPARIYRSSHALPSARNGTAKPNDTYATVLQAACAAGVIPDWDDSAFRGVPVDILGRLIAENSLGGDDYKGLIHIENRHPPSLKSLLKLLLESRPGAAAPACVPFDEWKQRCLQAAPQLPGAAASLVSVLFADRPDGAAVDHMFGAHPTDTGYFERRGQAAKLADLTPAAYWRVVQSNAGW